MKGNIICVVFLILYFTSISLAVRTDYMTKHCGKSLILSREDAGSLKVHLTPDRIYMPNSDCFVTVVVEGNMRIHLDFLEMDINSYFHCPGDYLQVFGGLQPITKESFQFSNQGGRKFCGNNIPKSLSSEHSNLTLRFVSDGHFHGEGFTILITAYHEGTCKEDEYRCSNSRCIHDSLYCDGYDNCGDESDSCPMPSFLVIGYVLSGVVFVFGLLFLVAVLRYRWSKALQEDSYDDYVDDVLPPLSPPPYETIAGPSPPSYHHATTSPLPAISVISSCDQTFSNTDDTLTARPSQ